MINELSFCLQVAFQVQFLGHLLKKVQRWSFDQLWVCLAFDRVLVKRYWWNCLGKLSFISTKVALRRPMTYDDLTAHPSIPSIPQSLWMNLRRYQDWTTRWTILNQDVLQKKDKNTQRLKDKRTERKYQNTKRQYTGIRRLPNEFQLVNYRVFF